MDKAEAIERLDALEDEAKKLREIIEREAEIKYDRDKMYIAIFNGHHYILMGSNCDHYFRWHSMGLDGNGRPSTQAWSNNHLTGQAALDCATQSGQLWEFDEPREALEYFLAHV